uniref:Uncharacterized protein n=1 Tax=Anguilla anguilla TaxID=7936 RepID=A0A0E9QS39_ANGAN
MTPISKVFQISLRFYHIYYILLI